MVSANSLPRTPPVCRPSAIDPANGPNPTAMTQIRTQTSSGMARNRFRIMRAVQKIASPRILRLQDRSSDSCRAARRRVAGSASSRPSTAPEAVPITEMLMVWSASPPTSR